MAEDGVKTVQRLGHEILFLLLVLNATGVLPAIVGPLCECCGERIGDRSKLACTSDGAVRIWHIDNDTCLTAAVADPQVRTTFREGKRCG